MKILVLGSSGFIGKAIVEGLKDKGYDTATPRYDFAQEPSVELWKERIRGFDGVINAVGIIAQTSNQSFKALHSDTPKALFEAANQLGISKVIQISALGADEEAKSAYHLSKKEADDYLRTLSVHYAILKPSIVYGEGGKSTALFGALANLPLLPIIDKGDQRLQPLFIEDLVATVIKALESNQNPIELDCVGKERLSYQELLQKFRAWLGKKPTKTIPIPSSLAIFGKILGEPIMNKESIMMLKRGSVANATPLTNFLGYTPKSIDETLFRHHATKSQKLSANLYFFAPLLRLVIAFVWIWSGIVSAFFYPQEGVLALLGDVGIGGDWALPTLYFASYLDITVGMMILLNYRIVCMLWFSVIIIVGYTLIITLLAPHHWLHPFGCVLKNIPLLMSIFVAIVLERNR